MSNHSLIIIYNHLAQVNEKNNMYRVCDVYMQYIATNRANLSDDVLSLSLFSRSFFLHLKFELN